jgi:hypothetical protein
MRYLTSITFLLAFFLFFFAKDTYAQQCGTVVGNPVCSGPNGSIYEFCQEECGSYDLVIGCADVIFPGTGSPFECVCDNLSQACDFPDYGGCDIVPLNDQCIANGIVIGDLPPYVSCGVSGSIETCCDTLQSCAEQETPTPTPTTAPVPQSGTPIPRYNFFPNSYPFPCNKVASGDMTLANDSQFRDYEFHSLRPYQASPCNPLFEDLALYCGSHLYVSDSITVTKTYTSADFSTSTYSSAPNPPEGSSNFPCYYCNENGQCVQNPISACNPDVGCDPNSNNPVQCGDCVRDWNTFTERCSFTISGSRSFSVDLEGAEFPIMGYTEPSVGYEGDEPKVINSIYRGEETITFRQRMNEYVSWYLNGVTGKAEYPPEEEGKYKDCRSVEPASEGCFVNYPYKVLCKYDSCCEEMLADYSGCIRNGFEWSWVPTCTPGPLGTNYRWCCAQSLSEPDSGQIYSCTNGVCDDGETCRSYGGSCACVPDDVEKDSSYKIVNLSGPLKKLLPVRVQHDLRIAQIDDAYESKANDAEIRHDQYAACMYSLSIFGIVDFGGFIAPCYPEPGLSGFFRSIALNPIRLSYWDSRADNLIQQLLPDWTREGRIPPLEEDYADSSWEEYMLDYKKWRGSYCIPFALPALPIIGQQTLYLCFDHPLRPNFWSNAFHYIPMASTEDRLGKIEILNAVIQPIISPDFRIISATITNQTNSDLFFAHMEEADGLGEALQKTYAPRDSDLLSISDGGYVPSSPFCDLREIRINPGDKLFPGEIGATINYTAQATCTFSLPGDGNLCSALTNGEAACYGSSYGGGCATNWICDTYYGPADCNYGPSSPGQGNICGTNCTCELPNSIIPLGPTSNTLCYSEMTEAGYDSPVCIDENIASYYSCEAGPFTFGGCQDYAGSNYQCAANCTFTQNVQSLPNTESCTQPIYVAAQTQTSTPLADNVWARFVAGTNSVFRKIFPQIGTGNTLQGIWDMPTATIVNIDPSSGVDFSGNPNSGMSQTAEFFFPHIGGVKEYFLTGIQTMLRPKGYGRQIITADAAPNQFTDPVDDSGGTCPDICSAECNPNPTNVNLSGVRERVIDLANRWIDGPGTPRTDRIDYVIQQSLSRGVDPIFTLAIWLHETAASDYLGICLRHGGGDPESLYCQRIQDFGYNRLEAMTIISFNPATQSVTVIEDNFELQLNMFLGRSEYYYYTLCSSAMSVANCPFEVWGTVYAYGPGDDMSCTPTCSGMGYVAGIKTIYEWVQPNQVFPCYPIALP